MVYKLSFGNTRYSLNIETWKQCSRDVPSVSGSSHYRTFNTQYIIHYSAVGVVLLLCVLVEQESGRFRWKLTIFLIRHPTETPIRCWTDRSQCVSVVGSLCQHGSPPHNTSSSGWRTGLTSQLSLRLTSTKRNIEEPVSMRVVTFNICTFFGIESEKKKNIKWNKIFLLYYIIHRFALYQSFCIESYRSTIIFFYLNPERILQPESTEEYFFGFYT